MVYNGIRRYLMVSLFMAMSFGVSGQIQMTIRGLDGGGGGGGNGLLVNLLAAFEFDEASGNLIDKYATYNHTVSGVTYQEAGPIQYSYRFDGTSTDYTQLYTTDLQYLNPMTQSYTLSMWVKSADPTPNSTSRRLVEYWSGSGGYPFSWQISQSGGDNIGMIIYNGSIVNRADVTGADVWDNQWHLVVMVLDHSAAKVRAYLDGSFYTEGNITFPSYSTTANLWRFGRGSTGVNNNINANIA